MQINEFKLQVLNDHKVFYMLDKINADHEAVFLFKETPSGRVEKTFFQAYKMNDNKVLIAFPNEMLTTTDYNYIAVAGDVEESINIQCYEKIHSIYTKTPDNDMGVFAFTNSLPIVFDIETGRCDTENYGPAGFSRDGSVAEPIVDDVSKLITYEPVLSVNGLGHIIFFHMKDDEDLAEWGVNNFEIPSVARTLMELLKIMVEWAEVYKPPFNNKEPITEKIIKFFETVGADSSFIDHVKANQVDMQVVQFLLGNPNARVRPDGVLPLTAEVESWLLPKLCFMTLSKLLEFYPNALDAGEILEKEKEVFSSRTARAFSRYGMEYRQDSLDEIGYCVNTAVMNVGNEDIRTFLTSYFELLKFKRDMLNSMQLGQSE
jgi:hypothetical protein